MRRLRNISLTTQSGGVHTSTGEDGRSPSGAHLDHKCSHLSAHVSDLFMMFTSLLYETRINERVTLHAL